jgi:hypothetical protein
MAQGGGGVGYALVYAGPPGSAGGEAAAAAEYVRAKRARAKRARRRARGKHLRQKRVCAGGWRGRKRSEQEEEGAAAAAALLRQKRASGSLGRGTSEASAIKGRPSAAEAGSVAEPPRGRRGCTRARLHVRSVALHTHSVAHGRSVAHALGCMRPRLHTGARLHARSVARALGRTLHALATRTRLHTRLGCARARLQAGAPLTILSCSLRSQVRAAQRSVQRGLRPRGPQPHRLPPPPRPALRPRAARLAAAGLLRCVAPVPLLVRARRAGGRAALQVRGAGPAQGPVGPAALLRGVRGGRGRGRGGERCQRVRSGGHERPREQAGGG